MSKQWLIIAIISIVNFIYADITEKYEQIEKDYHRLYSLAREGDWLFLEIRLQQIDFSKRIEELVSTELSNVNDQSQEEKKKQLQKWLGELKIWLAYIEDAHHSKCERPFYRINKKISQMKKMYSKGEKTNRKYFFIRVVEIHNEIMPVLSKYKDMQYKIVQQALKKCSLFYNLAKEKLIIFDILDRIHINGIIYLPKDRKQSIVFLNNKVFRVNDRFRYNFVIKEIYDGKVVVERNNKCFVLYEKGSHKEISR